MQKRLSEIDYMRAIAILSVIMIHVSGAYTATSRYAYFANQAVRYAVPIFIILSGFSLYYTDMNRAQESYLSFIKKRFRKVFVPYIIWSFIYIYFNVQKSNEILTWSLIGRKLVHGLSSYHLYFIIIILQLYLIYPLLRKLFKRFCGVILAVSFLVTFYYQLVTYLSAAGIYYLPIRELFFANYTILFTWIFYFVFGMYLATKLEKLNKISGYIIPLSILWALSLCVVLWDSSVTKTFELSIRPSIMLYSLTSFVFLYSVCSAVSSRFEKLGGVLNWISAQSFLIYFGHVLLLDKLIENILRYRIPFILSRGAGMLVLYGMTCAATFCLAYIVSYIPHNSIIGAQPAKRHLPLSQLPGNTHKENI